MDKLSISYHMHVLKCTQDARKYIRATHETSGISQESEKFIWTDEFDNLWIDMYDDSKLEDPKSKQPHKQPRIGNEYQAIIPDLLNNPN